MPDLFRPPWRGVLTLAPLLLAWSTSGCHAALIPESTAAPIPQSAGEKETVRAVPPAVFSPPATALQSTGQKLFLNSCAHCHGADARGDEGPDLHALELSDRRIATIIHNGIKGEMPSFAKKHSPEDITALTAYLRTLE